MTQIDKTGHMSDYLDSSSFFFSNFYISVCPEDCDMAQCGRYGPHHPERSAKEICFEDSPDRNAGWLAGWVSCLVFEVVVSTF